MRAITPAQARKQKKFVIPDFVLQAFNELIVKNLQNGSSRFVQDEVVRRIKEDLEDEAEFDYDWLDVEPVYEEAGWKVEYDKPGYNETYPASFTFRAR